MYNIDVGAADASSAADARVRAAAPWSYAYPSSCRPQVSNDDDDDDDNDHDDNDHNGYDGGCDDDDDDDNDGAIYVAKNRCFELNICMIRHTLKDDWLFPVGVDGCISSTRHAKRVCVCDAPARSLEKQFLAKEFIYWWKASLV